MRRIAAIALGLLVLGTACEIDPCDRYVDYMCRCHDGEEGFDCETLERVYADAEGDPAAQDQCAEDLADQKAEDEAEGHWCASDTGF